MNQLLFRYLNFWLATVFKWWYLLASFCIVSFSTVKPCMVVAHQEFEQVALDLLHHLPLVLEFVGLDSVAKVLFPLLSCLYYTILYWNCQGVLGDLGFVSLYKIFERFLCILPAFKNSARLAPRRAEQREARIMRTFHFKFFSSYTNHHCV